MQVCPQELFDEIKVLKTEVIARGQRLLDLSMVNPDIPPPRLLLDKLVEAVHKTNNHRYSVSRGIRRLRQAFAGKYSRSFSVDLDPENEVCVCMGSKDALSATLKVLASQFTLQGVPLTAVVPEPVYPAHVWALRDAGFRVIPLPFKNVSGLIESLTNLTKNQRVSVLLTAFPHNPTGLTLGREEWNLIADICRDADTYILNDFVYGELPISVVNSEKVVLVSALNVSERAKVLETYSLSKSYSVPGWRVGALLGNAQIVKAVSSYKEQMDYGIFIPIQIASAIALETTEDLLANSKEQYSRRVSFLVKGLRQRGFQVESPSAGLSVWACLPDAYRLGLAYGKSASRSFSQTLLEVSGVAVLPGDAFSLGINEASKQNENFVRFAVVAPESELARALDAIDRLGI